MNKFTFLFSTSLFIFAGCGQQDYNQAPPQEFVGTWEAESTQKVQGLDIKATNQVSEDLTPVAKVYRLKVDATGAVSTADLQQPYESVGTLNSDAQFVPTKGTEEDYLGGFELFSAPAVSVSPLIHFKATEDATKGPMLEMEIQVVMNSAAGLYTSGVNERRIFRKVSLGQ